MTPQERKQYRAIGGRLAVVLRQRKEQLPSPAAMQGIAADLVGDKTEILLPLKDLLSRPGFQLLLAKAGSGRGVVERQALLADLEKTFSPAVITALEELLGGFLDLPMTSGSAPSEVRTEPHSVPRAQERANQKQQEQTSPTPTTAPVPAPQTPSKKAGNPVALALGVSVLTATLAVAGTAFIRHPLFCAAFGLCPSSSASTAVQQTLDAARRAVSDLESATSLVSYRSAAADLERELQRLRSETLTPEQRRQLEELADISRRAQAAVLQDEAEQEQLQKAAAALAAARQLTGAEQMVQLTGAEQALQAIGAGGFAAAEATRLRTDVSALQAKQQRTPVAPLAEARPQRQPAAAAPSVPRSSVPSSAAPRPVTRAPKASSGGEWRDQPLF